MSSNFVRGKPELIGQDMKNWKEDLRAVGEVEWSGEKERGKEWKRREDVV